MLEKEHKDLGEALWVLIRHRQVPLTLQAANVALKEEVDREWVVATVVVLLDVRHEGNLANGCIGVCCVLVDGLKSYFDLGRWIVLIEVDHLQVLCLRLRHHGQSFTQLILEKLDRAGTGRFNALADRFSRVLFEVGVQTRLTNRIVLNHGKVLSFFETHLLEGLAETRLCEVCLAHTWDSNWEHDHDLSLLDCCGGHLGGDLSLTGFGSSLS